MNKRQIEIIRKQVSWGKWRFILKRGILFWGIPMAVILYILNTIIITGRLEWNANPALFTLGLGIIAGIIFGILTWHIYNRKLKKIDSI